jgi:hypothetical protein
MGWGRRGAIRWCPVATVGGGRCATWKGWGGGVVDVGHVARDTCDRVCHRPPDGTDLGVPGTAE